ncbi:MAG: RlmE family RNA methyltransferase [Deltaproteobacteria bacterium]|nr:RlmE family RNA methyltransferase [Deltaproteobacteria bacterium]
MKKVQDYYFKKAKQDNYPARSVYKLEEAQQKHHIIKAGNKVLDLGCHPGSWSLYAAKIAGREGLVVGVDLQKSTIAPVAGGARIEFICADIGADDFIASLSDKLPFQVVISDLAPRTTGHKFSDHLKSIELSRQALAIASHVLCRGGHFYCKVFQGEDFPDFVNEVRLLFHKTKVVKPKSSRVESREVFVLGVEFKGVEQCRAAAAKVQAEV